MNFQHSERSRALAGQYVLGTLVGRARRRFDRLCATPAGAALMRERVAWEAALARFNARVAPVVPREVVWASLQQRIAQASGTVTPLPSRSSRALRVWASLATAASVALAVALGYSVTHPPQRPVPYIATLTLPKAPMHFAFTLSPDRGEMTVAATGSYPGLAGHSLELWWISKTGPVALGVLPTQGSGRMPVPKAMLAEAGAVTLAISLEPQGGSPTGQPTGPVLTSGAALRAG